MKYKDSDTNILMVSTFTESFKYVSLSKNESNSLSAVRFAQNIFFASLVLMDGTVHIAMIISFQRLYVACGTNKREDELRIRGMPIGSFVVGCIYTVI